MIAVVQRVLEASVEIKGAIKGKTGVGFLILLGVAHDDTEDDLDWLSKKIAGMRIFSDDEGKMNLGLKEVNGSVLVISQFTLHASTKKGNRPSFLDAAKPEKAIPLYEKFIKSLESQIGRSI
jgi:D-tyrosyl-tRNA(Tyr) deacylase